MSLAVSRAEGVTVLTVTSDPSSVCPPLCQLLGALCYSPGLCSALARRLPLQRGGPQAALGALWILTGVLHTGLGIILIIPWGPGVDMTRDTGCPFWLGVLFVLFGVTCVLSERYPRLVLVLLNGLLNLIGAALSITAIVWYSTDLRDRGFYLYCHKESYYYQNKWRRPPTTTPSPDQSALLERCEEARHLQRVLTTSILAVLVTLSVLNLCLGISSATLSFEALKKGLSKNKPLLKEDKATAGVEEEE